MAENISPRSPAPSPHIHAHHHVHHIVGEGHAHHAHHHHTSHGHTVKQPSFLLSYSASQRLIAVSPLIAVLWLGIFWAMSGV